MSEDVFNLNGQAVASDLLRVIEERDRLRASLGEVRRLIDDPGVRHLQPANWRARVLAVLATSPEEGADV